MLIKFKQLKSMIAKTIFESLKDKLENGEINIRQAAESLYEHGWTNFVDIDKTKELLDK